MALSATRPGVLSKGPSPHANSAAKPLSPQTRVTAPTPTHQPLSTECAAALAASTASGPRAAVATLGSLLCDPRYHQLYIRDAYKQQDKPVAHRLCVAGLRCSGACVWEVHRCGAALLVL
jgi:hypothetical protein